MRTVDPLLPFNTGPVNGRKALESGSSAEDFDCAKRGRSRDMAVIPVCRTQALEGAWMPWAAEDEPRWAAVAVWGEPRQSVPVRRRQGSAEEARDRGRRFVQGRTDDAAAREKFPELPGRFHVV